MYSSSPGMKLELGSEQHFGFQVTVTLEFGNVPPSQNFFHFLIEAILHNVRPLGVPPQVGGNFWLVFRPKQHWPSLDIGQCTISAMLWSNLCKNCSTSVNRPKEQIFTKLSEQGSFFQGSQNEYSKFCAMINTEQKLGFFSVNSELNFTKLSEQGLFLRQLKRVQ